MKRWLNFSVLACGVLIFSAWLVRLGMQSVIPLPVSDSMIELALAIYSAQDQEQATNLIAVLGLLVWVPITALLCWCFLRFVIRRRDTAD